MKTEVMLQVEMDKEEACTFIFGLFFQVSFEACKLSTGGAVKLISVSAKQVFTAEFLLPSMCLTIV